MASFEVTVPATIFYTLTVEADNRDEAIDKVWQEIETADLSDLISGPADFGRDSNNWDVVSNEPKTTGLSAGTF
jgi:hypothetical protein